MASQEGSISSMVGSDSMLFSVQPGVVNFGIGAPGPSLLKDAREILLQASKSRLASNAAAGSELCMQYGPCEGDGNARRLIAEFLTRNGDIYPVQMQDLFLTCGATSGLALCCSLLLPPGGNVVIEDP